MATRFKILYRNLFDNYDTLTMTTGAAASGFALTNLLDDKKATTFRSTNLTSPKIKVTWAANQTLSGVAMAFTNLISGSTFQVTMYNATSGGTLLYDSGAVAVSYNYEIPLGFTSIGSASFAYGGGAHASVFTDSAVSTVRRMEIEFTSSGNPDGYIEISRIIAGLALDPGSYPSEGVILSFDDSTTAERTASGNLITDRGTISRAMDLSLQYLNATNKAALLSMVRSVGRSQPVFISLLSDTAVAEEQLSTQIYGKFDQNLALDIQALQRYNTSLRIIEI